jgi:hypothetical protein
MDGRIPSSLSLRERAGVRGRGSQVVLGVERALILTFSRREKGPDRRVTA